MSLPPGANLGASPTETEAPLGPSDTTPLLEPAEQFRDAFSGPTGDAVITANSVINDYLVVFVVAFIITLLITPIVRRIAIRAEIVDWPDRSRKAHREPVAYLGGVAVFAGLIGGFVASYLTAWFHPALDTVPLNIVAAMSIIMFCGLFDDIYHWDPNLKVGLQFVAAAFLALDEQIGGRVAVGLLSPIEHSLAALLHNPELSLAALDIMPGAGVFPVDFVYWTGAIIIGVFVLGGCNAANLIDGLDGLLTGTTAIMAASLLVITLVIAAMFPQMAGDLTGTRVILCFALLGATLGFLPHNFRPATIFLGDAGSLLLGFTVIVVILLLGETGYTHLVFAGLIVFGLPIVDTTLAILRRRLNRLPLSAPDDDHLHHMLKRTRLGTVGAVLTLYGVSIVFSLIALLLVLLRARMVYALVLVLGGFIVVIGVKAARLKQVQAETRTLGDTAGTDPVRRGASRRSSAKPTIVPPEPVATNKPKRVSATSNGAGTGSAPSARPSESV